MYFVNSINYVYPAVKSRGLIKKICSPAEFETVSLFVGENTFVI